MVSLRHFVRVFFSKLRFMLFSNTNMYNDYLIQICVHPRSLDRVFCSTYLSLGIKLLRLSNRTITESHINLALVVAD